MTLYKKTIVIYGNDARQVQDACQIAVMAARSPSSIVAYGLNGDPQKVDILRDKDIIPCVVEILGPQDFVIK